MNVLSRSLMVFASITLASCASMVGDKPYAQIHQWTGSGGLATYHARIVGLDGAMKFEDRSPYTVDPGLHVLLVTTSGPTRRAVNETSKTMYLAAKPCQAYFIATEHSCSTCDEWEPIVRVSREIKGCLALEEAASDPAQGGGRGVIAPTALTRPDSESSSTPVVRSHP